jgi:hypothetical protein
MTMQENYAASDVFSYLQSGDVSEGSPGPVTGYRLVVPSVLGVGEGFSLRVKPLTDPYACPWWIWRHRQYPLPTGPFNLSPRGLRYMDNVPLGCEAVASVSCEGLEGPAEIRFADLPGLYERDSRPIGRIEGFRFTSPGVKVIVLRDGEGREARSNPVWVTEAEPAERLWWGDIHCQTYFSDGLRMPEELFGFARDEAFLDVFALSDHSDPLTPGMWSYFREATRGFNEPGRFVTLLGLEWTSKEYGHRNVYYPTDEGPNLLPSDPRGLAGVYETAREHGALVIPHHSANDRIGCDWSLGHDAEVERLVEIYSIWGNSERPAEAGNGRPITRLGGEVKGRHVVDALAMGRKLGFVGGGDIHDGRPGDDLHRAQRFRYESDGRAYSAGFYRQGITGIWARELTRESIFRAMWDRRVYATSNVRPIVRWEANGEPMGSTVQCDGEVELSLTVASEVPVAEVAIVRNGQTWQRIEPGCGVVEQRFGDAPDGPSWYYARIERADGELAWSSPVWVERT